MEASLTQQNIIINMDNMDRSEDSYKTNETLNKWDDGIIRPGVRGSIVIYRGLSRQQPVSLFNYYKIVKTQNHGSGNMKSGLISSTEH